MILGNGEEYKLFYNFIINEIEGIFHFKCLLLGLEKLNTLIWKPFKSSPKMST